MPGIHLRGVLATPELLAGIEVGEYAARFVKKAEVVAYEDLGTEAIRRLEVEGHGPAEVLCHEAPLGVRLQDATVVKTRRRASTGTACGSKQARTTG